MNLLDQINRQLDGDLDRRNFKHVARYDPKLSRIEMHLSQRAHEAHVCGRLFPSVVAFLAVFPVGLWPAVGAINCAMERCRSV